MTSRRVERSLVAAGILLSRLAGLVRLRVFAHYFGLQSDAADAFNAAFRIPNFLQNLFGEGALSASFIPGLCRAAVAAASAARPTASPARSARCWRWSSPCWCWLGVVATPLLIALIAPGFTGEKRALTIALVRILFPGAGLLVLSAWCLGILNSHQRFLLSYAAPVMWNAAMIATLLAFGRDTRAAASWRCCSRGDRSPAARCSSPCSCRSCSGSRQTCASRFDTTSEHVRTVVANFVPVFISRGVVQVSAYIDSLLASLLPTGAVTGLANAQLLYTLPVSLFGMSIAAAELPAMSGRRRRRGFEALRGRLNAGLRQIAFFVVPSAMAFLALGDVVAAALLQTGRFRPRGRALCRGASWPDPRSACSPSTLGRLYSSTYYALRDTRTPLRYALVRVALTTVLGYLFAIPLPRLARRAALWGAAGLDGVGGYRRLGRDAAAAPLAERAHRPDRSARRLCRRSCGRRRLAAAAVGWAIKLDAAAAASRPHRRRGPRTLRRGISRHDAGRSGIPEAGTVFGKLRIRK